MRLKVADLFCGAGGTSAGVVEACEHLGYECELTAINHWDTAIATHQANHGGARHLCTSVDDVNPRSLFAERELDLLWASPECTHHSVARGGRPINDQSRATAWCVIRWAEALRPNVILIENVPEFQTWGPLDSRGRPIAKRKGEIFRSWVANLKAIGYRVDWRVLCAANYGDPTTRRRLFVQAVRGRRRPVWPLPTHGPGTSRPWVAAREIIDWSIPSPSIYARRRPLSENTMERIMEGLGKFGLRPSIVCMEHGGNVDSTDLPVRTITTARGGAMGVATPFIMSAGGPVCPPRSVEEPVGTVLTRDHRALVHPFLVELRGTGADQLTNSARSLDAPVSALATSGAHHALVEPALLPQHGGGALRPISEPVPTITTDGAVALVEPFLIEYYGNGGAESIDNPLNTVTTKDRHALVRPSVVVEGRRYLLDIGFRMLQPHELAGAQGFRPGYQFAGNKSEQVKQIGNAVPRRMARALAIAALSQCASVPFDE